MSAQIYLTKWDVKRLRELIETANLSSNRDTKHVHELNEKLKSGIVVDPERIPSDTITMNSKVLLKNLDSEETMIYTIVYPWDANIDENKISILAPVGTALIGKTIGDIVSWKVPAGLRRLEVLDILYQPEANGHLYF